MLASEAVLSNTPHAFQLLLVEDDSGDAELVNERLSEVPGYAFDISVAENLGEAIKVLERAAPDAIVLDLNLPDSSGMETLRRIREVSPETAVVVLTGDDSPSLRLQTMEEGAQDFIGKDEPTARLLARSILYALERIKVRNRQRQIEGLIRANPDAVIVAERTGIVRFVNDAALELFGRKPEELIGQELGFSTNENAPSQIEVIRGNEQRIAEMMVGRIEWEGKPAYIASIRDITDRLHTEERLVQAQKMEAIGQLTGGIAHDFNNLIQVIIASVEMLSDSTRGIEEARKYTQSISLAAERAAELTRYLLAFARRQPLNVTAVDIGRLMEASLIFVRRLLGEDIELTVSVAPDLPPVVGDAAQLESAILNLCVNARDAMPGGGRLAIAAVEISVGIPPAPGFDDVAPGRYVGITVADTGGGMVPETLARAFDPFFTTKEMGKGSGLGLSMVYGLTRQLGGHAKIFSAPGQGTTVRLLLPLAEVAPIPGPCPAAPARGRGETVLVVEDNALVRGAVEQMLLAQGYRVATAGDGAAALEWFAAGGKADLLFTDIVLPGGINGKQLANKVRETYPGITVLFTSGYAERVAAHEVMRDGETEILSKPYKRAELVSRVRQALDGEGGKRDN